MELSDLKKLRKIVPGSVFIFYSVPLYQFFSTNIFTFDSSLKFTIEGYGSVLAFIIGSFFSSLKIRSIKNKKSFDEINANIKNRLIEAAMGPNFTHPDLKDIKESKKLMHIFYHFIDNNESLKEKSKLVRDNGLFWTSMADVAILSCFFSCIYSVLVWVIGPDPLLVAAGIMIGCIGLIAGEIIFPIAVKNHISLGNDQIDFINTLNRAELQNKVSQLFS